MQWLRRIHVDGLVLVVLAAIVLATLLPAQGSAEAGVVGVTRGAIAALFVLYGARLSPQDARRGLKRWRLHALILACTFLVFPILGVLARALVPLALPESLYIGLLFLCLVPSTTLSSIAFTSTARGSVPDAIIGASASNLLGMFVTPLLVLALMGATGQAGVDIAVMVDILLQLLLPFAIGVALRPRLQSWLAAHPGQVRRLERAALALVVYTAFTTGVDDHIWVAVSPWHVVGVIVICIAIFAIMVGAAQGLGALTRLAREERVVLQFCGTQKSLATGLPMALVMFSGERIGLVALPLIAYYQIQIMVSSALAARYGPPAPDGLELQREP